MWRLCLLPALLMAIACSRDNSSSGTTSVIMQFTMTGASMEPSVPNGTVLNVLRYDTPVERGDIIVFYGPTRIDRAFLKRVIAVPGEEIAIQATGQVSIYGTQLVEPYAEGPTLCGLNGQGCAYLVPVVDRQDDIPMVPDGGTSPREHSDNNDIENPACARTGCYFVMGDNRQNSSDSRQGWLVPAENIIGYAEEPN